jgi:hypothetical protein
MAVLVLAGGCASPPETVDEVALLHEELAEARRRIARLEDEMAAQKAAREAEESKAYVELFEAHMRIAHLADEVTAQKAALDGMEDADVKRLREQVHRLSRTVAEYQVRYGLRGGRKGSEGRVLRVEGASVTISVGSNDGTQVGDIYHIRRGVAYPLYVGKMTIASVERSRSQGMFDNEFPGPEAPPQVGDIAYPGGR